MSNNASRSLSGLKILVVDDSKTIRRTAETLLSKEGCQVFTAIDGFDALSKIAVMLSIGSMTTPTEIFLSGISVVLFSSI